MSIRKLSQTDIDIISAGEVILNLCSVVKELVDNAIDSNATSISIQINDRVLTVSDNGCGMSMNDLILCCQNHTTSKFIGPTLGFRGEAIYSISTVSKTSIISRTCDMEYANCIECWSGNVYETAGNIGTIVCVKDLFYNMPVRRQFIGHESKSISNLIQKYTICYSNISFVLNLRGNIKTYSPNAIFQYTNIYHFSGKNADYFTHGYIMKTRSEKHFMFVNNRIVHNSKIHNIILNALNKIGMKRGVSYVIFVEVPDFFIDINIHPQKTDVRFLSNSIFDFIYTTISKDLSVSHQNHNHCQSEFYKVEYIGIVYNRYILGTNGKDLFIVDAHAAHERIVAEDLKKNNYSMQRLIVPIEIHLTEDQQLSIHNKCLQKIFQYEIINNILIIHAAIDCLHYTESDLVDMIYGVLNSNETMESILYDSLHTYGCLSALRHCHHLSVNDCTKILEKLFECENGSFCNHGRSTFLKWSLEDLNKQFER